jgi:hypothetical protein
MATPRSFKQINTPDRTLQLIQANIENAISGAINSPLLNGVLLEAVALSSGTTGVEHKLARVPKGYIILDKNNSASIYTASKDSNFLNLTSSVACTVTLWII